MNIEQAVVENLKTLDYQKQREVLTFIEFLKYKKDTNGKPPLKNLEGLWKGVEITEEDIEEVRREMWANFPREDF
ncbi:MAG: DUF2281 domain-containing protein [Pyrinomonadaceae bacterium]|nr:DUF2281 domain-containing protein [Pyrinomonadaceae bacterium]